MTLEEFSNEKTIPHKTGFIRNLQASLCLQARGIQ